MANKQDIIHGIEEKLGVESLDENASLSDLGIDSLDVVEYLLEIEEEYNIEFPPEEMKDLKTVGELIKIIENKIA